MSNDAKFWVARSAAFAAIAVDLLLLQKIRDTAGVPGAHGTIWASAFFVAVILTLPLGLVAYIAKRKRWEKAKPMDRVEVETLAGYSKQERIAKEQDKLKK